MGIYILEGLGMGLVLACSLGPIFFALTQTSIEEGVLPGMTVGLGIWISDLIIVSLYYFCLLYTSPSPRDQRGSRMPSSA